MNSSSSSSSSSSPCESPPSLLSFIFLSTTTTTTCNGVVGVGGSWTLRDYATREFNAFLWVSLIAVTALLLEKVFSILMLWAKGRRLPGPRCPSFFGHQNFSSHDNFIDLLSESHQKYGSVFKLWWGPTHLLVSINDPELIKEMLLKAGDKLPFSGRAFRLAFGRSNLFFCSYDQAQKRRESLAMELNGKMMGREQVVPSNVLNCIKERIQQNMVEGSIECKLVSQQMAFTLLGTTLFGDAFLAWSKATFYEELLMMIARDASFWASYRVTPFWRVGFWRYQSLCMKLKGLTQDIIQQCRKHYKLFCQMDQNSRNETAKNGLKTPSSAVMQDRIFSQVLDGHLHAKEEPYGNIMGVMFHGCIATAGLIGNIMERLVSDPELQDKIYSEIILAKNGSAKDQDVDKLHLLLATIYESARLLPAPPMLQRCSLKDDLSLKNGVIIPAGAVVFVPVQLLQMDNYIWGSDASKFNPYRFLSKAGEASDFVQDTLIKEEPVDPIHLPFILNDPNNHAAFLPFGSGIRACVGQKFVIQGVATLFASLLECYEVKLKPGLGSDAKLTSAEIAFVRRDS